MAKVSVAFVWDSPNTSSDELSPSTDDDDDDAETVLDGGKDENKEEKEEEEEEERDALLLFLGISLSACFLFPIESVVLDFSSDDCQ